MKSVYDLVIEMESFQKERDSILKSLEKNKATVEDLTKLEELEIKYNEIDNIIIKKGVKFNVYKYKEAKEDLARWESMSVFSALLSAPRDYSANRREKQERLSIITNDLKSIIIKEQ